MSKGSTFTQFKKGSDSHRWSGVPTATIVKLYGEGLTQRQIAKQVGMSCYGISYRLKTAGIQARSNPFQPNTEHLNWKGNGAGYSAFHKRIHRKLGQPRYCEQCGLSDTRRVYHWANLSGKYDEPSDYQRMCVSCHRKYDNARKCSSPTNRT